MPRVEKRRTSPESREGGVDPEASGKKLLDGACLLEESITQDLVRRFQGGDRGAIDDLLIHNQRLFRNIAKKFKWAFPGGSLTVEDLASHGMMGFIRAVEKFDASRGNKLSTYAVWWIRQSIKRAIDDDGGVIRIPAWVRATAAKIRKFREDFEPKSGRSPTSREMGEGLGITKEQLWAVRAAYGAARIRSYGSTISPDGGFFSSEEGVPETDMTDEIARKEEWAMIAEYLDGDPAAIGIRPRNMDVFKARIGWDAEMMRPGHGRMTMKEVGKRFRITKERVRQIEAHVMKRVRGAIRTRLSRQDPTDA